MATLDGDTSPICQELDGQHFPMKSYQVGVTAPPFHPNCRSCTCPYFDDEFSKDNLRVARGEDGKTYHVPADMTYKEWKEKYVADSASSTDKEQFERYSKKLGDRGPKTLEEFMKIKYNEDTYLWEKLKDEVNTSNYLQNQLAYIWNGKQEFIPDKTKFSETAKTIAGLGSAKEIRDAPRLVATYGGVANDWAKKVVVIESNSAIFDVHWYEYEGTQYEAKVKLLKERKVK